MHVAWTNVSQPVAPTAKIQIGFDRLLSPASTLRQTFGVRDLSGNFVLPNVVYDPVTRVVTLQDPSPTHASAWLTADLTYRLTIGTPQSDSDPNGLRAIDGATLDPSSPNDFEFQVKSSAPSPPSAPAVDFCRDVLPIFQTNCGTSQCHGGPASDADGGLYWAPAEGLLLTSAQGLLATAIDRVAQESNTGARSGAGQPASARKFGIDMPIVDRGIDSTSGGDPGNSWILYKMLMGQQLPSATDAGAPLGDDERAALANLVPGREMPFPGDPSAPSAVLTVDQLETISLWIQQAAKVPPQCQ